MWNAKLYNLCSLEGALPEDESVMNGSQQKEKKRKTKSG